MNEMTRQEFLGGWMLLVAQPWGKPYRDNSAHATIQLELYYRNVKRCNAHVWAACCEYAAQGDHWPSLGELKQSIQANSRMAAGELEDQNARLRYQEAPWALKSCWEYQETHRCTFKEAIEAVLPVWLAENPDHDDAGRAEHLLAQARDNFGIRAERGNVRCAR